MSKSGWKTQYWFNDNASNFHEKFRQLLLTEPHLQNFKCYQEINVKDLIPSYPYESHHYDWYIEELGTIVELHGAQHYKPINYGGIGKDDLEVNFRRMQYRDSMKESAAKAEGFTYVIIPYTEEKDLSYELLLKYIYEAGANDENTRN